MKSAKTFWTSVFSAKKKFELLLPVFLLTF